MEDRKTIKESMDMLYESAKKELSHLATNVALSTTMHKIWFGDGWNKEYEHQDMAKALDRMFVSDIFDFYVAMEREQS